MKTHSSRLLAGLVFAAAPAGAQTVFFEHTFDEVANDTTVPNIQGFSNGVNGATSDLVTGVCGGGGTSATGFNTDAAIDLSGVSTFTVEFAVENGPAGPAGATSNGCFFGAVASATNANGTGGTSLYNNVGEAADPAVGLQVGSTRGDGASATEFVIDAGGQTYVSLANNFVDDGTTGYTISVTYSLDSGSGNTEVSIVSSGLAPNLNFTELTSIPYATFADGITPNVSAQTTTINLLSIRIFEPDNSDDDGDGLLDSWELAQTGVTDLEDLDGNVMTISGSGPGTGDFDGDLLLDKDEFDEMTDAGVTDSDGDLLLDGEEVHGLKNPYQAAAPGSPLMTAPGLRTEPLIGDSDMDGLTDFEEVDDANGSITNPQSDDTDGDFLFDQFEVLNDLDPTDTEGENGTEGDPDGDLFDNLNEQDFGTDPRNAHSDGDLLNDGEEFDLTNPIIPILITNPLDADTDGDGLNDDVEVNGVTDPVVADSDSDGFLDRVEIAAGTNPNGPETPTLATITWSASVLGSQYDLITNGPLVLAENCNGPSATVNGIPFAGAVDDTAFKNTANFVTLITSQAEGGEFYDDEDPVLSPLLQTIWTASTSPTVSVFGLTPGLPYVIQVGRADDRNFGSIVDRFYTIDGVGGEVSTDSVGTTNTIFGGSANPAILFTGSFIATEPVQSFDIRQFNTGADTSGNGANVINFIQVRQTDDLTTSGPPVEVKIASAGFNGAAFEIGFENLDPSKFYQLVRSADLADGFPTMVDGPRSPEGSSEVFSDPSPLLNEGFYVLEEVIPQ